MPAGLSVIGAAPVVHVGADVTVTVAPVGTVLSVAGGVPAVTAVKPAPPERVVVVGRDDRVVGVVADPRVVGVEADDRVVAVAGEDRVVAVPGEGVAAVLALAV